MFLLEIFKSVEEEIDFIINHANKYLTDKIAEKDVLSTFAGLRPLIKKNDISSTAVLSRDHTILISATGLITVSGGKWTTYRKIAEDVIDKAIGVAGLEQKKCVTKKLPILAPLKIVNNEDELLQDYTGISDKEIQYFAEEEMAMTVEDILARRTRILLLNASAAINIAPSVAKQLAIVLNKDELWINDQLSAFNKVGRNYLLPLE